LTVYRKRVAKIGKKQFIGKHHFGFCLGMRGGETYEEGEPRATKKDLVTSQDQDPCLLARKGEERTEPMQVLARKKRKSYALHKTRRPGTFVSLQRAKKRRIASALCRKGKGRESFRPRPRKKKDGKTLKKGG